MELSTKSNLFEYVVDIQKLSNDSDDDLIIAGAVSDANEDLDGEYVDQGSLKKAWDKYLKNPVIRLMHDDKLGAIGKVIPQFTSIDGKVHKTGFVNGEPHIVAIISKAPDMESIRTKIREGIYSGLSIGGRAKKITKQGKTSLVIRDLLEISVVDIPSNGNAFFTVVKAACVGDNCPINKETVYGDIIMEKEEIVEIVTKTLSEMKATDDLIVLQKKYDDLKKSIDTPQTEAKVDHEVDVIKTLTDKIEAMQTDIAEMRGTPIQKGVQDGVVPVEKAATDITSQILARHYGGA